MFKIFSNAFKVKEIRNKIFFVFFIVFIFRIGNVIPLPGLDVTMFHLITGKSQSGLSIRALLGGGVGTIFSMGIGPFITSSIVMQLLTYAIPYFEQLQKEGQDGRNKINQYTRGVAVLLAVIQGGASVYGLTKYTTIFGQLNLFKAPSVLLYVFATLTMVTGTIFIMWLGEILTERGFGNGTSFIIFANILSGFPSQIYGLIESFRVEGVFVASFNSIASLLGVLVLFILVIFFAVLVQDGERRIPVQYSKKMVGRQLIGGQSSFIPLKVNMAGVMSIIFAMSLMQLPQLISGFVNWEWLTNLATTLDQSNSTVIGTIVYIVLIFFFTFFYTSFAVNPNEMAENIKKSGGSVPGIRPGKATADHIQNTVSRLSWVGACCYALIAFAPILFEWVTKIKVGFGGTTLLIISSTALEIVKQLESMLLMRHYKGFLK